MQQLLDLDVLELVCEWLDDAATVLSFALVSHALLPVAWKRLLRMRPVADAESRLPFVRALEIRVHKVDEQARQDVVRRILDLLGRVTHLESLTLPHPKYLHVQMPCGSASTRSYRPISYAARARASGGVLRGGGDYQIYAFGLVAACPPCLAGFATPLW